MVETKKTKKKKNKEKNGPKKKMQTKQQSRRPYALVIKPTEGKTYADVLSKVKKDTTLQEVDLAVCGVCKALSGDVPLILKKATPQKFARRSARNSAKMQSSTLEYRK